MIAPIAALSLPLAPVPLVPVPMAPGISGFAAILSGAAASKAPVIAPPVAFAAETAGLAVAEPKALPPADVVSVMTIPVQARRGATNDALRDAAPVLPPSPAPAARSPTPTDKIAEDDKEAGDDPVAVPPAVFVVPIAQPVVAVTRLEPAPVATEPELVEDAAPSARVLPQAEQPVAAPAEDIPPPTTTAQPQSPVERQAASSPASPRAIALPDLTPTIARLMSSPDVVVAQLPMAVAVAVPMPMTTAPTLVAAAAIPTPVSPRDESATNPEPATVAAAVLAPPPVLPAAAVPVARPVPVADGRALAGTAEAAPPVVPMAVRAAASRAAPPPKSSERLRDPAPAFSAALGAQMPSAPPPRSAHPASPPPASRAAVEAPVPRGFSIDTAALGSVGADVTRHPDDGNRVHVHFAVDRGATASPITGGDGLDRALASAGARLDTVTVEVRGDRSATASSGQWAAAGSDGQPPAAGSGSQPNPRSDDRQSPHRQPDSRRPANTPVTTTPPSSERFA